MEASGTLKRSAKRCPVGSEQDLSTHLESRSENGTACAYPDDGALEGAITTVQHLKGVRDFRLTYNLNKRHMMMNVMSIIEMIGALSWECLS